MLLDGLALNGDAWCTTGQLHGSVADVLAVCREHDVQGMVAKRVDSPYRPGETFSQLDQRQDGILEVVVCGTTSRALSAADDCSP